MISILWSQWPNTTGQIGKSTKRSFHATYMYFTDKPTTSGLFWSAFMVDQENIFFIASWDTAQLNAEEVDGYCDSLADVMRKLADEKNWSRRVGEVFMATC